MLEIILSYISVQDLIWLIVALPLAAFIINGAIALLASFYRLEEPRLLVLSVSVFTTLLAFLSTILVGYILYGFEGVSPSVVTGPLFSWRGFFMRPLEFGLKFDQLSLVGVFVIGLAGLLIMIYSLGFFSKRKKVASLFSLMSFVYALSLLLVLTDNLFLFFVIWQLLGIAGFVFMTGFFRNPHSFKSSAIYFVIEMLSGSALILVMYLVWKAFLDYSDLNLDIFQFSSIQAGVPLLLPYATVICFALMISVLIRSLQFPLYVWLPEVVSAPWPVFSFMYVISMVVVSVYILIRLNFLLILSPDILDVIAVLGAVAAVYGAASAIVQKRVSKLIAYLVISQIGLAFVAVGIGAFSSAMFHVFTHATYFTVIIMGVGSVIQITKSDRLEDMGGFKKVLPVTFWTTLIGVLAAAGIYPLSGFFGRMNVLWESYQRGRFVLFLVGVAASIFVAIALFRMIALIFYGRERQPLSGHVEESSVSMLSTMVIASFVALVSGWLGVSEAFGGANLFGRWLETGLATQMVHMIGDARFSELVVGVVVLLLVVHAGFITWIVYVQKRSWPVKLADSFPKINNLLLNGFYLNKLYGFLFIRPLSFLGDVVVFKGIDTLVINGALFGSIGRTIELIAEVFKRIKLRRYTYYILILFFGLLFFIGSTMF